jgi:hypothetical protein
MEKVTLGTLQVKPSPMICTNGGSTNSPETWSTSQILAKTFSLETPLSPLSSICPWDPWQPLKTFQMQSSIWLIQPQILVVLNILKQLNANLYAHTWHNSLSKASSLQPADCTPSYPSLPTEVNRHKLQIAQSLCFRFPDKLEPISTRKKIPLTAPKTKP